MKNQLVLLSDETTASKARRDGGKSRRRPADRNADRAHRGAEAARQALREAVQRATEREEARRQAREDALLAALAQPHLPLDADLPRRHAA